MFKRIFTNEQLSYFFQIAIIINLTGLLLDVIVYRYFPDYSFLKLLCENLSNLSIFVVCLIIVSQTMFIFIQKHQTLTTRHKTTALTIGIIISTFLVWLLRIDNDLQEKFIIYCSSLSQADHNNRAILVLIAICIMLLLNFYHTDISVPQAIRATLHLFIRKYLLMFISFFGIFHLTKIHKFSLAFVNYTQSSIVSKLTFLEFFIPMIWISAIGYYIYNHFYLKKNDNNDK
jgi:hypothetical protein